MSKLRLGSILLTLLVTACADVDSASVDDELEPEANIESQSAAIMNAPSVEAEAASLGVGRLIVSGIPACGFQALNESVGTTAYHCLKNLITTQVKVRIGSDVRAVHGWYRVSPSSDLAVVYMERWRPGFRQAAIKYPGGTQTVWCTGRGKTMPSGQRVYSDDIRGAYFTAHSYNGLAFLVTGHASSPGATLTNGDSGSPCRLVTAGARSTWPVVGAVGGTSVINAYPNAF